MSNGSDDNKLIVPDVEIVEQGKQGNTTRMDPAVLGFLMQASATSQLVKLRKIKESEVPIGSKSFNWTIGTTLVEVNLADPWISISIINDGPNSVYLRINKLIGNILQEAPIQNGETYTMDFDYPLIEKLYFQTAVGTAVLRVYAELGKWA